MNSFTIGVFDSGLGGLTAMETLSRLLPHEDILYFGDTGHMPYGGRSREQLIYMARHNISFLEGLGAKLILAACGTVTSVALDTVSSETSTPLFGVAHPAVNASKNTTKNKKIGFIATQACIDSGYNQKLLQSAIPDALITARACPMFVPMIESGISSPNSPELMAAIEQYLGDLRDADVDTLILGCTHYPIISQAIQLYMGDDVKLINSAAEAAGSLAVELALLGHKPNASHKGMRAYYTSGDAEIFLSLASNLLGHRPDGEVISIPPYPLI